MPFQALHPIWVSDNRSYKSTQLGAVIHKLKPSSTIADITSYDIALISVGTGVFELSFRQAFYQLFSGNWKKSIIDLGEIISSENDDINTCFQIKELCSVLLKNEVYPIVIAPEQYVVLGMYQAFEQLEQLVNIASIDALLDLGNSEAFIDPNSYISQIISHTPSYLHHFTNIGYQSYYVSQEELDFMQKMSFDTHRLGSFFDDITKVEPLLRNTDLISLDLCSVQAKDLGNDYGFTNGFTSREICQIARYAGISPKSKCIGIFGYAGHSLSQNLLGQILWYIIEGFHFRLEEYPLENHPNFVKYIVPIDSYEIVFFKSLITDRWWIKPYHQQDKQLIQSQLIPCHKSLYTEALKGTIPEAWWNAYRL